MKTQKPISFFITLILSFHSYAQNKVVVEEKHPLIIGEGISIGSEILGENRLLNIHLPNGYSEDSGRTYPVIYLLDGSFDDDFLHIVGLVQFGSFSWINMLPESIVVGISNVDRKRDFTYPSKNKRDKEELPTSGESEKFISFIENELQPFINLNYKTDSFKTIIGQSLGGLLATEILFKKPGLFDNYIIVSPSLWWDDESLLKSKALEYKSKKSIYIAVGKEGEVMERASKELYNKLNLEKLENTKLYFDFFEEQTHGNVLHVAVYAAFKKIFKADTK